MIVLISSEFCGHENTPKQFSLEAVPQGHSADYLLEPAPAAASEGGKGEGKLKSKDPNNDEKETPGKKEESGRKKGGLVIFAVDISGSMCTTTEVPALQGRYMYICGCVLCCHLGVSYCMSYNEWM